MRLIDARSLALSALTVLLGASPSFAAGWGTIKGQIIYDGAPPAPVIAVAQGQAPKDGEVCAANGPIEEQGLVVDEASKGIANVVVYISKKPKEIHPALAKPADAEITFDNKACVFVPHVLVVRTDQSVRAINSDACGHNVKTNMSRNKAENQLLVANGTKGYECTFKLAELLPMKVECNIHAWMTAFWFVVDHPYAVVTDAQGNFEIQNLPEGEHEFKIWQEKAGYLERSLKVNVKDGAVTDLGQLKFSPTKFK